MNLNKLQQNAINDAMSQLISAPAFTGETTWPDIRFGPYSFQGSNYGYAAGGYNGTAYQTTIERFPFSSDTDASSVGNLYETRAYMEGVPSSAYGYVFGGDFITDVQQFPFANPAGTASDAGDLAFIMAGGAPSSSGTHGYMAGGFGPAPRSYYSSIQEWSFASGGTASPLPFGLTQVRGYIAGHSSTTHGYASGGLKDNPFPNRAAYNIIDKFPFSSGGPATDVGDAFPFGFYSMSGQSSTTHGYVTGGQTLPPLGVYASSILRKFPFASDANATPIGSLPFGVRNGAGQSSEDNGYVSGGYAGPPGVRRDNIQKFPFSSDTSASDVANLTEGKNVVTGINY